MITKRELKPKMITKRELELIMTVAAASLTIAGLHAADPKPSALPAFECPFMAHPSASETMKDCPLMQMSSHAAGVDERGDKAMGFSHTKTTHHFRVFADGGAIEVEANDVNDEESRTAIRKHLAEITSMFAAGNFKIPFQVHAQIPAGADTMEKLKSKILYRYEDTGKGGRVRLITNDVDALKAVHEFIRFQIEEHRTGDTIEVQNPPEPPRK